MKVSPSRISTFTGRIVFISSTLDRDKRSAHIWIEVDNRAGKLKPEMFGDFSLVSVPINLFNRNQGGIATTLATQRTAGAEYAYLELLVEKEVIAAHSDALLASEEVRLLEDAKAWPDRPDGSGRGGE